MTSSVDNPTTGIYMGAEEIAPQAPEQRLPLSEGACTQPRNGAAPPGGAITGTQEEAGGRALRGPSR